MVLWRTIMYVRADDEGNFDPDPLARRRFIFYGRSVYQLTGVLSILLREWFFGIRLCVQAGSQGLRTLLVTDLPANEQTMDIVVLTAGSQGTVGLCAGLPCGVAIRALGLFSKISVEDIAAMRIIIYLGGSTQFSDVFENAIQPVNLNQITQQKSYEEFLGTPLEQTVPNTCAIVSSTMCVEVHHRWEYETRYGTNTFPCTSASPRKLRSACRRAGCWKANEGAYVGDVMQMIQRLGGVRTTNAPTPAPSFLPLHSWQLHKWDIGNGLTEERVIELLDTRGPFVGTLWVCPWYHLFDVAEDNDLVYRSGCARNKALQEFSESCFGKGLVGLHSVLCFEYRVREGELEVLLLDNHTPTGPKRWIWFYELEEVHTIRVERMESLHLGGRTLTYPRSGRSLDLEEDNT